MIKLDESNLRSWPPSGASASSESHVAEQPPETASIDTASLTHRALDGVFEKEAAEMEPVPTKDLWKHPEANAIVLILMLLDKYGQEYLSWHPETLKLTMLRDGLEVSNKSWNKIMAGRVILNSPSPWRQWEVMHWVCRALCGETPNFVYLEEPELGHLVTGFEMMKIVDPKRATSTEVDKYIAAAFKAEGIPYIPFPLDEAQRELEDRKLECADCNALHRDDNDTKCITCGSTKLNKVPFEFEAIRDRCAELFEARSKMPLSEALNDLPDNGVGNAVYRLLVEWDLAKTVKSQMRQQLRMIGGTK